MPGGEIAAASCRRPLPLSRLGMSVIPRRSPRRQIFVGTENNEAFLAIAITSAVDDDGPCDTEAPRAARSSVSRRAVHGAAGPELIQPISGDRSTDDQAPARRRRLHRRLAGYFYPSADRRHECVVRQGLVDTRRWSRDRNKPAERRRRRLAAVRRDRRRRRQPRRPPLIGTRLSTSAARP